MRINLEVNLVFLKLAKICYEDRFLEMPVVQEAKRWQVGAPLENALTKETGGGVAILIRAGMSKTSSFLERVTKDDMRKLNLAHREGIFQKCDKLTRETGILCKQTMIMDMTGATLSSMMDRRQKRSHAEMSRIGSLVYPQLMDKFCVVNAPSWMGWVVSIFKKIASKRAMEKVELFTSPEALWASEWANRRLVRESFPCFIGGGVPDHKLSDEILGKMLSSADPLKLTIGARTKEFLTFEVPAFEEQNKHDAVTFEYCVSVQAKGIEMRAFFVPEDGSKDIVVREGGKIKADDGPSKGLWEITNGGKPGVLKVEFDNTYSRLRSKTVTYSFEII